MKVFFYSTPSANANDAQCKKIYNLLKKAGYDHVNHETVTHEVRNLVKKTNKEGKELDAMHKTISARLLRGALSADISIFEVSAQSLGLGYLIHKSLEDGRPTIVLYKDNNIPFMLFGVESEKLIIKSYDDKSLEKVLEEALTIAKEKKDKRFNFFITPKLLEFLETTSEVEGITKSKLLRDIIVDYMRKSAQKNSS